MLWQNPGMMGTITEWIQVIIAIIVLVQTTFFFVIKPRSKVRILCVEKIDFDLTEQPKKDSKRLVIYASNISNSTTAVIFKGVSINNEKTIAPKNDFSPNDPEYEVIQSGEVTRGYVVTHGDLASICNKFDIRGAIEIEAVFSNEDQKITKELIYKTNYR